MGEKKKPETASQMLEALNEFLLGEEPDFKNMPATKVTAYLQKEGLDAGGVFRAAQDALASARGQIELAKARDRRQRIQSRLEIPQRFSDGAREIVLQQIRNLSGAHAAQVYARKFEEAPDEDLRSLVEDFELLDQLDMGDDEE